MLHRLFPLASAFLAGIGPAFADVPVTDAARETTEKSISDCMTKARVYKEQTMQPSQGDYGRAWRRPGHGRLPSAGGDVSGSANNVTAASTASCPNMDLSAVQTTVSASWRETVVCARTRTRSRKRLARLGRGHERHSEESRPIPKPPAP